MVESVFFSLSKRISYLVRILFIIFSGGNNPLGIIKSMSSQLIKLNFISHKTGKASNPNLVVFLATFRCNLQCKGCSLYRVGGYFRNENMADLEDQELSFAEIKDFIDEIAKFFPMIILSGGELFIREDAVRLIEYIKSKKLLCIVITNGTLLNEEIIHRLIKCRLDKMVCSIDGLKEIHEGLRGVEGIFDKIVSNLQLLSKIKKMEKVKYPLLQINHTLFQENYLKIRLFGEYMNNIPDLDADILNFMHPVFLEKEVVSAHKDFINKQFGINSSMVGGISNVNIDSQKLSQEIKALIKVSKKWKFMVRFHLSLDGKEKYYYNSNYTPRGKKCPRVGRQISILPDGRMGYCSGVCLGNIKSSSFEEIWNGKNACSFRKVLSKGLLPYCKRCCYLNH